MTSSAKARRASLGKEAVLLFLALFYFAIATNTQSGWLFILSAFLLGLMLMCWLPPRRSARNGEISRTCVGSPQRGVPLIVRLEFTNLGHKPLREVLIVEPANPWAEQALEFRWVVPHLKPGETVSADYFLTPSRRGEHSLLGTRSTYGSPFGLFKVVKTAENDPPFLVYPRLLTLSPRRYRTRLAGILTDFTSPRDKGDSRSLRSLREYHAGDDLRMVHWKSSAKTGGATLLVREHHAPSRQLSLLVVDTSTRPASPEGEDRFEQSITLAASLLWSAHRSGTRATLLMLTGEGWQRVTRWEEQYRALARVAQQGELPFARWAEQAGRAIEQHPEARGGARPLLITSAVTPNDLDDPSGWPSWAGSSLLLAPPETSELFAAFPASLVDVEDGALQETIEHV